MLGKHKMKNNGSNYLKHTLLPLVVFSLVSGVLTGVVIFLFKIASSAVIGLSESIYSVARQELWPIPLILLGAALIGLLSALILKFVPECRGGGIPSAIAALRGEVPIKNVISLPFVFLASLLTYICGVPLGTEGPAVQMGTLVGWITSKTLGRKIGGWHRYVMTGGACAGFSAATGAPLTGIFFAFEEAHRRFTPMIFMSASLTTLFASITMELLCMLGGTHARLFTFTVGAVMPVQYMWSALVIGLVCGGAAILFTKAYKAINSILERVLRRIPFVLRIVIIFVSVAAVGLFSAELLGTGHHLIDVLVEGEGLWYMLIIYILVRGIFLMIANTQGVTGGLFIPSLAMGSMLGALCGKGMVALGILPSEYLTVTVIVGMVSFLAASSRVPITALAFSLEALSMHSNFLPVTIGVAVAFAVIELTGIHSFNDTVVDMKIAERNRGREVFENQVELIVKKGAFVVGREVRDVLWPPRCMVVSVIKDPDVRHDDGKIHEGDMLTVHYNTTHPEFIEEKLEELVGDQREFHDPIVLNENQGE